MCLGYKGVPGCSKVFFLFLYCDIFFNFPDVKLHKFSFCNYSEPHPQNHLCEAPSFAHAVILPYKMLICPNAGIHRTQLYEVSNSYHFLSYPILSYYLLEHLYGCSTHFKRISLYRCPVCFKIKFMFHAFCPRILPCH